MTYASEYFLVSLDDCKTYLGIDDSVKDSEIGYLMQAVSSWFNVMTGRKLVATDVTEYCDGMGTDTVFVDSYPINSDAATIEVYVDPDKEFGADTQLDEDEIAIRGDAGRIQRLGDTFPAGYGNVKVVYNGGYTEVPYDLRLAALETLGIMWRRMQEKNYDVTTISRGDTTRTFLDQLPHTVMNIVKNYKHYG